MTGGRKRATAEAAEAAGLALVVAALGLAAWGLFAAAAVAALIPAVGAALALAFVASGHVLVALVAGQRIRAILRRAEERRRARLVNVALIRSALMLLPGGRRPAARQGIAAILAVIALALFLMPARRRDTQDEKPEG